MSQIFFITLIIFIGLKSVKSSTNDSTVSTDDSTESTNDFVIKY